MADFHKAIETVLAHHRIPRVAEADDSLTEKDRGAVGFSCLAWRAGSGAGD